MNRRYNAKEMLIRCLVTAFFTLAVIGAFFYWIGTGGSFNNPFNDRQFDQKLWLSMAHSDKYDNPRGQMTYDIQRRWLRTGMTRQEVIKLLGEPDLSKQSDLYEYNLGPWSGFRVDIDSLDIYFDQSGRLQRTTITQH